VAVITWPRVG